MNEEQVQKQDMPVDEKSKRINELMVDLIGMRKRLKKEEEARRSY